MFDLSQPTPSHDLVTEDVGRDPSPDRRRLLDGLRASIAGVVGDRLDPEPGAGSRGWARRRRRLESWWEAHARTASDAPVSSPDEHDPSKVEPDRQIDLRVEPSESDDLDASSTSTTSSPSLIPVPAFPAPASSAPPVDRLAIGWTCLRSSRGDGADAGTESLDDRFGGGLVTAAIHEFLGDADDLRGRADDEVVAGGRTTSTLGDWVPCLGPIGAILRRRHEDRRRRGRAPLRTVWIGGRCRPTLSALCGDVDVDADVDDVELAARAVHVSTASTVTERRWCIEQAIRTAAIDAVVADARGFSLLDTRRLQVALAVRADAGHPPITVLLVRPQSDRRERSAATTRWLVEADPGGDPFGGAPSWRLRLLRVRMPQGTGEGRGDPTGLVVRVPLRSSLVSSCSASRFATPSATPTHRSEPVDVRSVCPPDRGDRPADLHRRPGSDSMATTARSDLSARQLRRSRRSGRARLRGAAWATRGDGLLFPSA